MVFKFKCLYYENHQNSTESEEILTIAEHSSRLFWKPIDLFSIDGCLIEIQ